MWMRRESEGPEARSYRTLRAVIIPGGRRFNSQKGTDPRTADREGTLLSEGDPKFSALPWISFKGWGEQPRSRAKGEDLRALHVFKLSQMGTVM